VSERIVSLLERYFQLSEEEAVDLADELDSLYNELKSRYLEALWKPEENRELAEKIIKRAVELVKAGSLGFEGELALIALLDILSTDLYDKHLLYRSGGEEG
jgi:molybdopterin/thiamine biosynthesis adenylyltransferase